MKLCSAILAVLLSTAPAFAGDEGALLSLFVGEWRSDREALGVEAESLMTWQPTLDGRFVRLDYKIMMAQHTFQGVAYYRTGAADPSQAFWADNSGGLYPIVVKHDGNALVANWGATSGKQGRTRYELLTENKMAVTDWVKTPKSWRQFNQNVFVKVSEPD